MYEILKNALNDALTEQYAAVLTNSAEEDYSFSQTFEQKMKKLIRKTDRPYYKYIGYLSATACAVIVIGCSILLPQLISEKVPVATTPPQSETSVTTPPSEVGIIVTTTTPAATIGEIVTSSSTETTTTTEITTTTELTTTTAATTTTLIENDITSAYEPDAEAEDGDVVDDEVNDGDEDIGKDDEAVIVEEDEDCDEELGYDDGRPSIPREKTFGEEISALIGAPLADSYPYNVTYCGNGITCDYSNALTEADIMEQFRDSNIAEMLEKAELIDELPEFAGKSIDVSISDVNPIYWNSSFQKTQITADYSPRNEYGYSYSNDDTGIEDEVAAEDFYDFYDDYSSCNFTIFENGVIEITSQYYSGSVWYRVDNETISEIFERAEANELTQNAETVGEVIGELADSVDDLRNVSLSTTGSGGVYDINMYADCENGEYVYKLLTEADSEHATLVTDSKSALLSFHFTSAKNNHRFSLSFYSDSTARIATGCASYSFAFPLEKSLDVLDYLCELNGKEPAYRYATLADYLDGKNFTAFSRLYTSLRTEDNAGTRVLTLDEAEADALNEIYEIIVQAADKAGYELSPIYDKTAAYIFCDVPNWNISVMLRDDHIIIGRNAFGLPSGTTEKILEIMKEKGVVNEEYYYEEEDCVEEIDD